MNSSTTIQVPLLLFPHTVPCDKDALKDYLIDLAEIPVLDFYPYDVFQLDEWGDVLSSKPRVGKICNIRLDGTTLVGDFVVYDSQLASMCIDGRMVVASAAVVIDGNTVYRDDRYRPFFYLKTLGLEFGTTDLNDILYDPHLNIEEFGSHMQSWIKYIQYVRRLNQDGIKGCYHNA